MFEYAISLKMLNNNPISTIKKLKHDEKGHYVPPVEDMIKVINNCTREEWIFINTYLQTAARKSEVLRLIWEDIDFQRGTIRLGTHKTETGDIKYRYIDMSDELSDGLSWWKENRPIKDSDYVFVNNDKRSKWYGMPYTARNDFMSGLCKRAGVKHFGFHGIRGYVATMLADQSVPAKVIQEVLGHASLSTTEKYIRKINKSYKDEMNLLATGRKVVDDPKADQ